MTENKDKEKSEKTEKKTVSEPLRRAARTFLQAAVGYITANLAAALAEGDTGDIEWVKSTLLCLGVSAVAAGLAALMNGLKIK